MVIRTIFRIIHCAVFSIHRFVDLFTDHIAYFSQIPLALILRIFLGPISRSHIVRSIVSELCIFVLSDFWIWFWTLKEFQIQNKIYFTPLSRYKQTILVVWWMGQFPSLTLNLEKYCIKNPFPSKVLFFSIYYTNIYTCTF